jgi:hypothetical protein
VATMWRQRDQNSIPDKRIRFSLVRSCLARSGDAEDCYKMGTGCVISGRGLKVPVVAGDY